MLYSEHIKHLAEIAQDIECIGIEKYEDGSDITLPFDIDKSRDVYLTTLQSRFCEATIYMYSPRLINPDDASDISFLENLHRSLETYVREYSEKQFSELEDINTLERLSMLCNQFTSYADWYDVLRYLNYDLPDCEWIYRY